MLAVSPLIRSNGDDCRDVPVDAGGFSMLEDFSDGGLLDNINFDDIFVGFDDGDILPDLEVYPAEVLAEFSSAGGDDESGTTTATTVPAMPTEKAASAAGGGGLQDVAAMDCKRKEDQKEMSQGEEVVSTAKADDLPVTPPEVRPSSPSVESDRGRKQSAAATRWSHGKRKVKVDWTPELHRRFVQAVEQLGVDKAVPSRILELMGIDCLTRHNVASHLQKYRSHRKHMLAREAEAASWSQRRQMYAAAGAGGKTDANPWLAPTIGFPPPPPPPPPSPAPAPPLRPLHVWGHPAAVDQSVVHVWPRHPAARTPSPAPAQWPATAQHPFLPRPADPSYWHQHYHRGAREGWMPHAMTQGTPCFPQPLPTARFQAPPVAGILPHPLYRPVVHPPPPPPPSLVKQTGSHDMQLDAHPSKESIDAAVGDVLAKPWLPLPLGLKPPSVDSVLVELQKQGVSKIPPTNSS